MELFWTHLHDIWGQLIRINAEGQIEYISPKIQSLISQLDLPLEQNYKVNLEDLQQLTYQFASMIGECVGIEPLQPETINLFINHQKPDRSRGDFLFRWSCGIYL